MPKKTQGYLNSQHFRFFLKTCITKQVNKTNKDKTNMKILRAYVQLMSIYTTSKI